VYPDGLKKRSRLTEPFELSRKKRQRRVDGQDEADDDADVVKYSQRHVEYFEQVKQAEIARIRAEYEQFIMKKDVEFQRLGQELGHTQERMAQQANEVNRLQGENRLLKRAVAIQNQQKEEVQNENHALKQLATQTAEHMKRLEQANYTLRVHLQTSNNAGLGHPQQPPDVY
jgi:predicted RNase H-like nuclease (RuvC/YqgF family)